MKKTLLLCALCFQAACVSTPTATKTVDVFKHDGSRQCQGGGISPETMQTQLSGIQVYQARKDVQRGVMFPAVCGGGTPHINVYTIAADDLERAKQRGFAPLVQREWD
ncbi:hypothetical protein MIS46_05400 [Wielerella bovis]|uniref:hypothetical protein n=1 Tax=Wielerella bovis TaxID=2917790 RepID=UPI0020192EC1|nr:hypothetical protein [Wielerella bovis]ULJ63482.1 hypothetical protein MIS46_05400 [Wielerella bovis]